MGQTVNQMGQNMNQMGPTMNQMSQNMGQMGQGVNQLGQNMGNQMGQNMNPMGQNLNQMGQNQMGHNQFMQNSNQMPFQNNMGQGMMNQMQTMHQIGQNSVMQNQMNQSMNQMGHNMNQMAPNVNQMTSNKMSSNMNQIGQNVNQIRPNMNQVGKNMGQNQLIPNGNQFGMNQFSHNMMAQPRMMPPPGMGMPRQSFSPNMNQFNQNFRGPSIPPKNEQPMLQPNMMNHPIKQINQMNQTNQVNQNMNQHIKPILNQSPPNKAQNLNQTLQNMNHQNVQNFSKQAQNLNHSGQSLNQQGQNLNHMGQNLNQQGQNSNLPKIKSRVYNNQNLTSQNLVQLIQNTHPMLQFNNSFHNASHHPILNNRLNNQMVNNHPMFNRQNGAFGNSNRLSNSDDSASESDDPYGGLMTQREKQWLINIQMLQLNTGTPYIHDFYYTVFLERQANKEKAGVKEAHKANQQNHPFYSGAVKQESETHRHNRERHNSHRHNSTSEDPPRTYVPTQFENSLGKLQCGSVTAPRKIIDVELVAEPAADRASRAPSVCSTTTPAEIPREMKRTKQMLLDIEALYLILLRLEELNDPLAISNALILKEREEKQRLLEAAQKEAENEPEEDSNSFLKTIESVQRRPKQDSPKSECIDKRQVVNLAVSQKPVPVKNLLDEDKDEILNKMFAGLLFGDRVPQMMTVRKGRVLLSRFLQRVPATHARLRALWSRILRALPSASRRDDGGLAALSPHYRKYMHNTTGWSAVIESCSHLSEALDPARTPHALTSALTLSCVCALMERAILLVNTPDATANERQWYKFLKTLARALKNTSLTVARPTHPLPEPKVMHHIKQLESRTTIEILQRGKAADFDLTKNDVSEQLVKHLC
ncbi:jg12040 [Pararge aegeria aegeria]|uniref:Jg12040 protein n=1 Tax=Pararge aegeria aegeria TaxID=348720 RepID=A0A8S4S1Y4_9NEOP|nr:jg12040 [Pararge aegeria aegeria]